MNVVVGDETGLLKLLDVEQQAVNKYSPEMTRSENSAAVAVQSRSYGVQGLCWNGGKQSFSSIRRDGAVDIWRYHSDSLQTYLMKSFPILSAAGNPRGIKELSSSNGMSLLSYDETGNVSIDSFDCSIHEDYDVASTVEHNKSLHTDFKVKGPLSVCGICKDNSIVFGGKENDLAIYDSTPISSNSKGKANDAGCQTPIWKAKNVPHDYLNLRVPIWITSMSVLRPDESSASKAHIMTGTAHKHVRLYDTAASTQPVMSMETKGDYPVTSICPCPDGNRVFVGDTAGDIHQWDLRTQRKLFTLKGFVGSIRDMKLSDDGTQLVCVSMDRYLRVFDAGNSNKLYKAFYLKNRLNACLVDGATVTGKKSKKSKGSSSDEDSSDADADGDEDSEDGEDEDDDENENVNDVLKAYKDSDDDDEEEEEELEEEEDDDEEDEDDEDDDEDDDEENDEEGEEGEDEEEEEEEEEKSEKDSGDDSDEDEYTKTGSRLERKKLKRKIPSHPVKSNTGSNSSSSGSSSRSRSSNSSSSSKKGSNKGKKASKHR